MADNEGNGTVVVPKHILQNVVDGTKALLSEKRVLHQKLDEMNHRVFTLERQLADQQLKLEAMQQSSKAPTTGVNVNRFKQLTLQVIKDKQKQVAPVKEVDVAATAKKDEEIHKLKMKTTELESLLLATRAITHQTAHREVITSTLNAARNLVSARRYSLALCNETATHVTIYSMSVVTAEELSYELNKKAPQLEDEGSILVDDTTTFGHVILTDTHYDSLQVSASGRFEKQLEELDFTPHSLLCIPIRNAHGAVLGAFQAITQRQHSDEYRQNQVFTSLDKERLEHLCVMSGSAVWNLKLSKERQTAQNRIEILLKLNRSISVEVDPVRVLEKIMEVSYELLHVERICLFQRIHGENDLFILHACDEAKGQYVSIDSGIAGLVARTGQVVTTNDAARHPAFDKDMDTKTGFATKKLLCVPVKDPEGNILAVVEAINKRDGMDFTIEDTLFLSYIAEAAGISLHKSYLHNEVIISKKLAEIRLTLSEFITSQTDIHRLTDLIMAQGKTIMECDRFGFLLVDHLKNELWITSTNLQDGEEITIRQPIYKGISGLVATTGDTVCTRDAYTHNLFDPTHDSMTGYRTKSVLCMPVFEENVPSNPKVVAVAMCINKLQGDQVIAFNSDDRATMGRFCKEIQYALGKLSLEVCYYKVVSDKRTSGSDEVTEAGIISSLLQKHSRRVSNSNTSENTKREVLQTDVFGRDVEVVSRPELDAWDLDILSFSFSEVMVSAQALFRAYGFVDQYFIAPEKLQAFVASVAQHYRTNPYHNFYHGFQVMHAAHIQMKLFARKLLPSLDIFSVLIAALCHDVDHPGNNNDFEVKCVSSIALTHNDDAVLERHHCRVTFIILNTPSTNILEKLSPEGFRQVRRNIIRCIMATDMTNHFPQVKVIENMSRAQWTEPSNRLFLMESIVHSCDLSAQALPFKLALRWGERALDEFQNQAKEELDMQLPVAPFMENLDSKATRYNVQANFICYVLQPMWQGLSSVAPMLRLYSDTLAQNLDHYRAELAETTRKQAGG
ncbi:3'5'-cyclic nucleotide phosphodiesterase [Achlya hypogyna]|uniref:Phosphodiesterase n=1 Tax=Achlya hypogyna TaxID=1202772 RepID=A0A1V9Z7A5_ACHHY|nr:3'5'-cyclic nucleotide phosphodiesterase [Achlya hypogyna]